MKLELRKNLFISEKVFKFFSEKLRNLKVSNFQDKDWIFFSILTLTFNNLLMTLYGHLLYQKTLKQHIEPH